MATFPRVPIKPARQFPANMTHALRLSVNQVTPNPGSGIVALTRDIPRHIGTIPAGSLVLPPSAIIKVAFSASVTINFGDPADEDGVFPTAGVAPTATGVKSDVTTGAYLGLTTRDIELWAIAEGAAVAAGEAEFYFPFYPQKD